MSRTWEIFFLAVQFMTRLPVPEDLPYSEARMAEATRFFPLVGALVGGVAVCVFWLTAFVFPPVVAAILAIAATMLVTGALHEDGLADAADGLGGGTTREKALAIMRDSAVGTYGVVTLGVTLLLTIAALSLMPEFVAGAALWAGHVISRYAAVLVIFQLPYARGDDAAKFPAPSVSKEGHLYAALVAGAAFVALWIFVGAAALSGVLVAGILGFAITWLYQRKLGGFTGDCLGATQQMTQLGLLLGVLAWP